MRHRQKNSEELNIEALIVFCYDHARSVYSSIPGQKSIADILRLLLDVVAPEKTLSPASISEAEKIALAWMDETLQTHLSRMESLLTNQGLLKAEKGSEVRSYAQRWTSTTLRQLDSLRKGTLVQYLCEAKLIRRAGAFITLAQAPLDRIALPRANLREADLHEANLREADLQEADLTGATLARANLQEANLQEANLQRAYLRRANLQEANLQRAVLAGADLVGCNLNGADLRRADLTSAKMDDTTQIDPKWRLVWEVVTHGAQARDLTGADLTGANLTRADLTRANLFKANLTGANLTGVNLAGGNLRGADLSQANLSEANLIQADLSQTDLSQANLSRAKYNTKTYKDKLGFIYRPIQWPNDFDPVAAGVIDVSSQLVRNESILT